MLIIVCHNRRKLSYRGRQHLIEAVRELGWVVLIDSEGRRVVHWANMAAELAQQ